MPNDEMPNLPARAATPSEFLLYQTEDGRTRLEVRLAGETVWLSLNDMAALFQRDKSVISRHIRNIFDEGELRRESVVANSATTAADGKTYQVEYFNLDVIISVGYRVHSHRGTQFRIWATQRLREYIIKGFALDDERLKRAGGGNYFDELLARIRDNRIVSLYLDYGELQALNRRPMYMRDWVAKLDDFLRLSERDILTHPGTVSHEAALAKAHTEYDKFRALLAAQPSTVERHFKEAIEHVKQLERCPAPPKRTTRQDNGPKSSGRKAQ